jgi:SAM-dependent methyltransferase
MSGDILKDLNVEELRGKFKQFTRRAFHLLPKMDKFRVLDIGCGSGAPTLEIAGLSNAEIIGIDVDQNALDKLSTKLEKTGFSSKIRIMNCSLYDVDFPDDHFDVLWEEGVIHILDLKKSLKMCNKILKPNGFFVSLESIKWYEDKFNTFSEFGFKLVDQFLLPEEYWWTDYYIPLEKRLKELREKYNNPADLKKLERYDNEVKMVKKNPKEFDCGFYIFQKIN